MATAREVIPPEGVAAARARLAASLRVGHGLDAAFEIRVIAGPVPLLTLAGSNVQTARWITRVLLPAYGRNSWARRPTSSRVPARDVYWGRRVRTWPDLFREPSNGPSATGHLVLALSSLPSGVLVRWQFRPCPAVWTRSLPLGARDGRQGVHEAPVLTGGRRAPSRPELLPGDFTVPLFWRVSLSLEFLSNLPFEEETRRAARRAVEGALRSGRGNGVRFHRRARFLAWHEPWFPLTEEELTLVLPGLADNTLVPARGNFGNGPILPIGRSDSGRVVGPVIEADQGRHLAILGETGMGKSATLIALARTATGLGGVVLFDPLGETAEAFVDGLPSDARQRRLLRVSPERGGAEINALEGIGTRSGDPVLSDRRLTDLVHALRRVRSGRYDSKYWGPRLEEMLTRALSAAAAFPSGTLVDAHTLLATGGRTRRVVPTEAQEAVRELADRVRERPDDAEGARRLLYEVVRSPVLRRMLCEPDPRLHGGELVAPGRIVVISGDASKVGESTARYLLAVYLALVWSELLARPSRSKTFVVLDEAQWFSHESLAEMLRLARRRNVHVVLATQTVGSLPEEVGEAVWTNVSDFVAFRGSPEEARELARTTSGVSVEDLLALPRGHAAVLLGKGNAVAWLRTVGRPPEAGRGHDEGIPRAATPPDPPVGQGISGSRPMPTAENVLAWIRSRALRPDRGATVRVDLAALREAVDPTGRAIREAGAILGRAGAIRSSVRTCAGSAWILDPARIPTAPSVSAGSPDTGAAEGPQLS